MMNSLSLQETHTRMVHAGSISRIIVSVLLRTSVMLIGGYLINDLFKISEFINSRNEYWLCFIVK